MFQWLTEIDKPVVNKSKELHSDLNIERLSENKDTYEISDVFLFFASPNIIFNIDFLTALPTPTKFSLNVILNEMAPHYNKVQVIKKKDNITTINLKFLKKHSQRLLNKALLEGVLGGIINDIYRTNELHISMHRLNLKYYKVNGKYIQTVKLEGFDRVMEFLESSFLTSGGPFTLSPSGWTLEEELKNSIAIRAFSSFSKEIILVVDSADNTVVAVYIYK